MFAVIVNVITVIIGSTVGLLCKKGIPKRLTDAEIEALKELEALIENTEYETPEGISAENIAAKVQIKKKKANRRHWLIMKKVLCLEDGAEYFFNAISGYYSNVDNSEGIKRMDSLLFGDKSRKIQQAGDTILANKDFYMKDIAVQAGV